MKKIAVVLSGCGFKDGAEITESVSSLIALAEAGVEYQSFAPNLSFDSTNHINDEKGDSRNTLTESGRIARGNVKDLSMLNVDEFDGVVFPGGYGAALHLCSFATEGSQCSVHPDAEKIIEGFHAQSKPIAAMCIAPALIAKVLGSKNITVTIGNDAETAKEIEKTGAYHENCTVDDYVSDRESKVITTPAYMYDQASPFDVFTGVRKAIFEFVEMA